MTIAKRQFLPPILAALVMSGLGAYTFTRERPADAEPYHARVRVAADKLPKEIGAWKSIEIQLDLGSVQLLKPNVMIERSYINERTEQKVTLVLVHCRDANDMLGHFPPSCYPNQGWEIASQQQCELPEGDRKIPAMEYVFQRVGRSATEEQMVDNFMILPTGQIARDMDGVYNVYRDRQKRFYGAGQIQLVYPSAISEENRDEIAGVFLQACKPVIDAILDAGDKK